MATWLDVQRKLRYNILHRTRKTVHSRSCPHLCPAPGPARSLGGRGGSLCPPHVVTLLPGPSHDHGCLTLCSPAPLGSCLKPVPRPPHAPHSARVSSGSSLASRPPQSGSASPPHGSASGSFTSCLFRGWQSPGTSFPHPCLAWLSTRLKLIDCSHRCSAHLRVSETLSWLWGQPPNRLRPFSHEA